jgi:hypothetical protein
MVTGVVLRTNHSFFLFFFIHCKECYRLLHCFPGRRIAEHLNDLISKLQYHQRHQILSGPLPLSHPHCRQLGGLVSFVPGKMDVCATVLLLGDGHVHSVVSLSNELLVVLPPLPLSHHYHGPMYNPQNLIL